MAGRSPIALAAAVLVALGAALAPRSAGSSPRDTVAALAGGLTVERPKPKGDLIFADDFRGRRGWRPSRRRWVRMSWCDEWGSLSCNTARRRNVALTGRGKLRITAIRQGWRDGYGNRGSWTTARLETQHKFSFKYGTLKARIKVPAGKGLWPSFWTTSVSKSGWPATGEIDVMELLGHDPRTYYCSLHGASRTGRHVPRTEGYSQGRSLARRFHVYAARWRPHRITYFVDGRRCGAIGTKTIQPIDAQQVLIGMAVGGEWPGSPDRSTPRRAHMLVDWVRVFSR